VEQTFDGQTFLALPSMPNTNYGLCLKIYDDETMYAVGGRRFNTRLRPALVNQKWSAVTKPDRCFKFNLKNDGQILLLNIGTKYCTSNIHQKAYVFKKSLGTWSRLADMPAAKGFPQCGIFTNRDGVKELVAIGIVSQCFV
jgi:hypothetical protein